MARPAQLSGPAEKQNSLMYSDCEELLLCHAISHVYQNLSFSPDVLRRMEGNLKFRLFREDIYHGNLDNLDSQLADRLKRELKDGSARGVTNFILDFLHQGLFSVSSYLVSLFYLSKFNAKTEIQMHASVWRPLCIISLLLADKMWE